jgi:hypothetical protein
MDATSGFPGCIDKCRPTGACCSRVKAAAGAKDTIMCATMAVTADTPVQQKSLLHKDVRHAIAGNVSDANHVQ